MPMAKVKVTEEKVRAIWCAARLSAPSRPARNPASAKTPTSAPKWRPMGTPTRRMRRSSSGSRRWRSAGRAGRGTCRMTQARKTTSPICTRLVASAEPPAPIGGIHRSGPVHAGRPCAAEDQEEIAEQVEHVRQHRGPDQRAGRAHRLRVAALGIEGEQRGDAREPPPDEVPRGPGDVRGDAERLEEVGERRASGSTSTALATSATRSACQ